MNEHLASAEQEILKAKDAYNEVYIHVTEEWQMDLMSEAEDMLDTALADIRVSIREVK